MKPSMLFLFSSNDYGSLAQLVLARRLLAEEWYRAVYCIDKNLDAFEHYVTTGVKKGFKPNPYFDPVWYKEHYPHYNDEMDNPLLHYASYGFKRGYSTSSFFDAAFYEERNTDVDFSQIPALLHFLEFGINEKRAPHPYFDTLSLDAWNGKIAHLYMHDSETIIEAAVSTVFSYTKKNGASFKEIDGIWTEEAEASQLFQEKHYVAEICSAVIVPGTATILVEGQTIALNDEVALCFDQFPTNSLKYQNQWRVHKDNCLLIKVPKAPIISISSGILLTREHDANYFHWISEIIPKAILAENLGIDESIPFLVQDDLSLQFYEALDHVCTSGRKVLKLKKNQRVKVENLTYISDLSRIMDLYYSSGSSQSTYLSFELLSELRLAMRKKLGQSGKRKLFLGRRKGIRLVVNREQIETLFVEEGFEVVDTSGLSFAQQVTLFSQASVVVAPTGAALTNILWCEPGTKVLIFASDHEYTNMTFWESLARIAQLDVEFIYGPRAHVIEGQYAVHDDYSVPVYRLRNFLQKLEM